MPYQKTNLQLDVVSRLLYGPGYFLRRQSSEAFLSTYLNDVDPGEVAPESMQAPICEGKLQKAEQAIEGVVDGHQFTKVLEAKHCSEDCKVGGVKEVSSKTPHNQCHCLHIATACPSL